MVGIERELAASILRPYTIGQPQWRRFAFTVAGGGEDFIEAPVELFETATANMERMANWLVGCAPTKVVRVPDHPKVWPMLATQARVWSEAGQDCHNQGSRDVRVLAAQPRVAVARSADG